MQPKAYTATAENMSPFLGPKQLAWLSTTDEFIYRTIYFPLIDGNDFDIYSDIISRPGTPPEICLSWLCLKNQYHVSYEDALLRLRFDRTWQLATGTLYMGESIPGGDKTISRFEERCAAYAKNNGVLNPIDIVSEKFATMSCALAGIDGHLMRSDSTPASGNFTVRSREDLLYMAVCAGVDWITCSAAPEQVKALDACDRLAKYKDPLFTLNRISDRWPASQDKRREMLCLDADALLEIYHMDDDSCKTKTVWESVINQQTKLNDQQVRVFAEKGDEQLNSSIIQSLLDEEATYRWKNGKSLWGYVLNAVEAANSKAHFIIFACLYPNNKADADMANELNLKYGPFFEKVDAIYDEFPVLKKGIRPSARM
ncbi:MAG: hypothetical protein IJ129_01670 [Ruminococcus sp.]|nr:hypothetical protein [Ruminococcus sp.]